MNLPLPVPAEPPAPPERPPPVQKPADAPARIPLALWVPFALAPILLAVLQLGRWHPDEVYQYLEPAWFRVHGYGVRAWEWQVGLRNWAAPMVLSWFLQLAHAAGIDHPRGYRAVMAVPQLVLHAAMVAAVWRYVSRRLPTLERRWVTLAFVLVAGFAPVILFAGRTMGESLSTAFLVMACERLDRDDASPARCGLWGGALLGLSVVARYGSTVFVLAALIWLVATRRWRVLGWTCLAGAVVAAGLAALDWGTWGAPFHSLLEYTKFNVLSGEAARRFGESPFWYYLPLIGLWVAAWAWPGLVAETVWRRRLPLAAFMAAVYLVAISATPHKEDRFLYPAIVLLALAGAPGAVTLLTRLRARTLRTGAVVMCLAASSAAWLFAPEFRGDQFRAQVIATRPPEVTGLLIVGEGLWGSGGHFYMGRNIPMYNADLPHHIQHVLRRDRRVNRVITFDGLNLHVIEAEGFQRIGQVGRETILARRQ